MEEAEEGESLGSHMVECAKLTHEWVEVSLLPTCSQFLKPTCSWRRCL